jgi:hypothetical protein
MFPGWTGPGGFEQFRDYVFKHLGPHPGKGWSIDRIENGGNYEPGNVRFIAARSPAPSPPWSEPGNRSCRDLSFVMTWRADRGDEKRIG